MKGTIKYILLSLVVSFVSVSAMATSSDEKVRHEVAKRDAIKYAAVQAGKNDASSKNSAIHNGQQIAMIQKLRNCQIAKNCHKVLSNSRMAVFSKGSVIVLNSSILEPEHNQRNEEVLYSQNNQGISFFDYIAVMNTSVPSQIVTKKEVERLILLASN